MGLVLRARASASSARRLRLLNSRITEWWTRHGHGVLEDAVPLTKDEVAHDDEGPSLVALGEEGEEDLDLLGGLLDVPDVVEDEALEGVELLERTGQCEVALGGKKLLDQAERRRKRT